MRTRPRPGLRLRWPRRTAPSLNQMHFCHFLHTPPVPARPPAPASAPPSCSTSTNASVQGHYVHAPRTVRTSSQLSPNSATGVFFCGRFKTVHRGPRERSEVPELKIGQKNPYRPIFRSTGPISVRHYVTFYSCGKYLPFFRFFNTLMKSEFIDTPSKRARRIAD